ncbi:MAG: tRNA (guanosine(37)-N1)-methyltransferase TrmD, partial [Anaerolineales bacterium]|nr:tRNA (guanosine(37)-N1)-methyltransferase TrmD [Anaerolineales bacterium]
MQFDVITLFPEMLAGYCEASILGRAAGLISVRLHQLRDYAVGKHRVTDEPPYGGGGGMVLKPEPLFAAVEAVRGEDVAAPVILLTPQGRPFTQAVAAELSRQPRLILVAGRYEGVDERVRQHLVTDEISTADFVLTG